LNRLGLRRSNSIVRTSGVGGLVELGETAQKTDFFSEIKEKLSLALMIYPVAVGLYGAGFFWEIPTDVIGVFEATDFVFKASILYALGVSTLLLPLLLITIMYGPIIGSDNIRAGIHGEALPKGDNVPWKTLEQKGKVIHGISSLGIITILAVVLYVEPQKISFNPNGLLLFLGAIFVGGIILRPFFAEILWETSKLIFIVTAVLLVPILIGFTDAIPKAGSPKLMVGKESCPVVFSGSKSLILKCRASVTVVERTDKQVLIWKVTPQS
jgi:hypothetical protein